MEPKELIELIKKRDGSVSKAAKNNGISNRQTMYNYIERYCNNQYEKIPKDVCKYFQRLDVKDGPGSSGEMDIIASLREKGDLQGESKVLLYMEDLARDQIRELEDELRDFDVQWTDQSDPTGIEKRRQDWVQSHKEDIAKLKEYIEKVREERMRINSEIASKCAFVPDDDPIDVRINRLVEQGGYGGPSWKGKDFGVISICDNGEYMVIVDETGLDSRDVKLYIYAIIGGKRTTIATYGFPNHNENFVRFRLVPKLSYYFEVKSPSMDYPNYTSGILELTNDT